MKLYSWNLNGIRAAEKKGFLNWLQETQADIIAVQETKAQIDQLSPTLLNPAGYSSYFVSAEKKGYSGVGLYIKNNVKINKIYQGFNEPEFDLEGRMIGVETPDFTLFNIYFPNGGRGPELVQYKLDYYKHILALVQTLTIQGQNIIITGDFNTAFAEIDLARPKENQKNSGFLPIEREGLGQFFASGFLDTFRYFHPDTVQYSWWDQKTRARDRNIGWRIDYFIISPSLLPQLKEATIHDQTLGSDHAPISITI